MNTKLVSILVAVIIVLAGVGLFIANNGSSNDSDTNENSSEQTGSSDSSSPAFSATNPFNESFVATISGTSDGQAFEAVLEADTEGNGRFSTAQDGKTVEFFFTADSYISCAEEVCYRTLSDGPSPFDKQQYIYTDEDFQEFKDLASYEGQQDCPAGRCDVWKVIDENENVESLIFLSTDNQRISKVVGTQNGETTTISYEFKDVTITLPENIQEIPSIN